MSQRELKRAGILERVAGGELRLVEGSELMGLSYRQGKRLWRRYREKGPAGLVHGNVGRSSNRAKPGKFRRRVLKLVREKYSGGEGSGLGRRWRQREGRGGRGGGLMLNTCSFSIWLLPLRRLPFRRHRVEHGAGTIRQVARTFGVHRRMVRQPHLLPSLSHIPPYRARGQVPFRALPPNPHPDPVRRVPLLSRRLSVPLQNLVDESLHRFQLQGILRPDPRDSLPPRT